MISMYERLTFVKQKSDFFWSLKLIKLESEQDPMQETNLDKKKMMNVDQRFSEYLLIFFLCMVFVFLSAIFALFQKLIIYPILNY